MSVIAFITVGILSVETPVTPHQEQLSKRKCCLTNITTDHLTGRDQMQYSQQDTVFLSTKTHQHTHAHAHSL